MQGVSRTAGAGPRGATGTVALVGGDEWTEPCSTFDARLLELAGTDEVLVLPAAAAFEHPERAVERATRYFETLGARVTGLPVVNRRDAESDANVSAVRVAKFVYVADGSPLHLRSVLKDSAFYEAMVYAYGRGAVIAASGAGATVLGDPMVDPRGGAYTVGLGLVPGLAIFPYHGRAAEHLRERSVDLLARDAVLVGIDEQTALVRTGAGPWDVTGAGGVTVYRKDAAPKPAKTGTTVELDGAATTSR
jgi:cyanophycinase